ncbi:MAG: tRNA (adenosine(37)-N6)-threonylcarbamoyltransferase complex transferase subunit TsaD [Rhodospirillales bacterium]
MILLGIETSCDETAAAVVDADRRIRADVVRGQIEAHRPWGGVVPEVAARAHLEVLDQVIARAMTEAGLGFADLAGVAATAGPGLIGGVIVGVTTAKAIALAHRLPFLAVNHLEGHALTARLISDEVDFPYLLLLVSGGHCQLLIVEGVGDYRRLGTTIDDALGEAFDKAAKLMGLGYPGGPLIERAAADGDPRRFALPRPMLGRPDCHFSFSGLKTAVRLAWEALPDAARDDRARRDLSASFQAAAGDVLVDRSVGAIRLFRQRHPVATTPTFVVAGGVAANGYLRLRLQAMARREGVRLVAPPQRLCTDNGAMIAWAGVERLRLGLVDDLDFAPRPRWPLDPGAAPAGFAGVKA